MRETQSAIEPHLVIENTRRRLCRWDAPDGACSIALDSNLMEDLRQRTIGAYISLPKRGAEIGGFLFGQVRQDGAIAFEIDTCEEIPCEYRFGPSYRLSESDYRRLSERMAQLRHDGCRPVIGLYRSYTGRDIALDQTDQELVRHLFPHEHVVSLLLQPISPEKCIARFQFASDGELGGRRRVRAVPIRALATEGRDLGRTGATRGGAGRTVERGAGRTARTAQAHARSAAIARRAPCPAAR